MPRPRWSPRSGAPGTSWVSSHGISIRASASGSGQSGRARRDHLAEQLRTLALPAARLRAADATSASSELTGDIRAVMREIDYRIQGTDAVRSSL
jgi:hypothetical protein